MRQSVNFHCAKGSESYREIATVLKSTVFDICKRFDYENRIDFIPQKERRRKLSSHDEDLRLRKILKLMYSIIISWNGLI